jgi:hypothetical protein
LSIDGIYFSDLNYKMAIFLSQTESTPKHFFLEKKHCIYLFIYFGYYTAFRFNRTAHLLSERNVLSGLYTYIKNIDN